MLEPTTSDCSPHLRIQVFRPIDSHEPKWYSVRSLSQRWPASQKTIKNWLRILDREGNGPHPDQALRFGMNRQSRHIWLREDYVAFMRNRFLFTPAHSYRRTIKPKP